MTDGKNFSSPSKPDQARISNFIRLEVMVLQRQPFWKRLWNVRQLYVFASNGDISTIKILNKKKTHDRWKDFFKT